MIFADFLNSIKVMWFRLVAIVLCAQVQHETGRLTTEYERRFREMEAALLYYARQRNYPGRSCVAFVGEPGVLGDRGSRALVALITAVPEQTGEWLKRSAA